jgi:nucleotide-binding universal stress UspA family protein
MTTNGIRRVLLHGSSEDSFDNSVAFAWRLVESFGAELHVVYTVEEPLSAGWTAEVSPTKLPELHQAIEEEARERLARVLPAHVSDVTIAIRTGEAGLELVQYTAENMVDLAIVRGDDEHARALLAHGHCSVLVLRS